MDIQYEEVDEKDHPGIVYINEMGDYSSYYSITI
jgi:hypothetical protein